MNSDPQRVTVNHNQEPKTTEKSHNTPEENTHQISPVRGEPEVGAVDNQSAISHK